MGILNIDHPDILDFIYAKTSEGKLENFNISVGIPDKFMESVKEGGYYKLKIGNKDYERKDFRKEELETFIANIEKSKAGAEVGEKALQHSLVLKEGVLYDRRTNEEIGRIRNEIVELNAPKVFDLIAAMAWKTGDPGILFLDKIAKYNPLPSERLEATNPCGEQPLHPYDACNLGSLNLSKFVSGKKIDYEKLEDRIKNVLRFMDNANDVSKGPIQEIEDNVQKNRRIGLGVMGFADMLIKLGVKYDSKEGINVAERLMEFINEKAHEASKQLGREKGAFPNFGKSIYKDGTPVRNLQRTTIAPTGSIAMVAGINSGIEPFYAATYNKNMRGGESVPCLIAPFEEIAKERGFYSEALIRRIRENKGSLKGISEIPDDVKEIMSFAMEISPEWHVRMQAAFQKHTENAVSKTINLPHSAKVDDVKKAYLLSWEMGCKGITVYRDGSKKVQVLDTNVCKKTEDSIQRELKRGEIEPLPEILDSKYIKQKTPWGTLHVHIDYGEDRKAKQVFAQLGKSGEVVSADLEIATRMISQNLRLGGSIESIIDQTEGIGSQKMVPTKEGTVSSLGDALAIVLKKYVEVMKFEEEKEKDNKGIDMYAIAQKVKEGGNGNHDGEYAEKCPNCKGKLIADSGCWRCEDNCGFSKC